MKKYNIGISLVLLAVSVAMFVTAAGLPASNDASIGPGSWPKVLACLMGVLSILLLIQSLGDKSGREAPFKPGAELKRVWRPVLRFWRFSAPFCILWAL